VGVGRRNHFLFEGFTEWRREEQGVGEGVFRWRERDSTRGTTNCWAGGRRMGGRGGCKRRGKGRRSRRTGRTRR